MRMVRNQNCNAKIKNTRTHRTEKNKTKQIEIVAHFPLTIIYHSRRKTRDNFFSITLRSFLYVIRDRPQQY